MLQIDAPDLAMERSFLFQDSSVREFQQVVETHIAALNRAVEDIPADRIRLHLCWGNYDGPHTHDVPLADILPILYQAKVGALALELANPRHQHEHKVLKIYPLPDSMLLIPGVIDSTNRFLIGQGRKNTAQDRIAVPKVKEGTTVQRTPIIGRDERRVKEAQQTVHALFDSLNHTLISGAYLKRGMEGAKHVAPR